jgi:hypothetical protein
MPRWNAEGSKRNFIEPKLRQHEIEARSDLLAPSISVLVKMTEISINK